MNCPLCPFEGAPRALHAHLAEAHSEVVCFDERAGRSFYAVTCPVCGEGYQHEIKPRGRDPGFVDEFTAQIRLVAFDMLVSHLMGEHEDLGPSEAEPEEAPPPVEVGPAAGPAWLVEARRKAASGAQPRPDKEE